MGQRWGSLGNIYFNVRNLEQSLFHYCKAIHYYEMIGNVYYAGTTRFNITLTLVSFNRLPDALEYARAALRNFQSFPQGAEENIKKTEGLIEEILKGM